MSQLWYDMSKQEKLRWEHRAERIEHKPNPVDVIPDQLHELGSVFFPIPRGVKGWSYPHHMDEYRYDPGSEVLNAYLEAGWGYGISCAGDIAVVDVDNLTYIEYVTDALPETAYQPSGSGDGYHLFYKCPGLNTRINMRMSPTETAHTVAEGYHELGRNDVHVGEVKCDPHGYVVGPGSVHPSGNRYGPLRGDSITEVDKEELESALNPLRLDAYSTVAHGGSHHVVGSNRGSNYTGITKARHEFYNLSAYDVTPWLSPSERAAHPVHGSSTDSNFMMNGDGETYTCWRCQAGAGEGCGINPTQLLSMIHQGNSLGDYACESIRADWSTDPRLHYYAWREAICRGLVQRTNPPYRVLLGFGLDRELIESEKELQGELYVEVSKAFRFFSRYRWD